VAIRVEVVSKVALGTNTTQDYESGTMGATQACIVVAAIAGSGSDANHSQYSIGFWDGTTARSLGTTSEHGVVVASNPNSARYESANIVNILDETDNTAARSATISAAPGGNGIRLTWAGTTSYLPRVQVLLINGLNSALYGTLTPNDTADGTATESGMSMTPKVIFAMSNGRNSGDGVAGSAGLSFGWVVNDTGYPQRSMGLACGDNTVAVAHYQVTDASPDTGGFCMYTTGSAINARFEVTSIAANTFEITTRYRGGATSGAANSDVFYLALDFDESAAAFSAVIPTTDVDWTPWTGGSFTPQAVVMLSGWNTIIDEASNYTTSGTDTASFGIYMATDDDQYGLYTCLEDAAATSNTSGRGDTKFVAQQNNATVDFDCTSPAFGAGTVTFDNANYTSGSGSVSAYAFGLVIEAAGSNINIEVPTGPWR
jgi:hypothetical protein